MFTAGVIWQSPTIFISIVNTVAILAVAGATGLFARYFFPEWAVDMELEPWHALIGFHS
jgi:hypothetical protein